MQITAIMKKAIFGSALAWLVQVGSAQAATVSAPGEVFYIDNQGAFVKRALTLTVPERGQGEVGLSNSNWSASTTKFFTIKQHGRTVFYVLFDNVAPYKPFLLRGTYLRGNNLAKYWGDLFHGSCDQGESFEACVNAMHHRHHKSNWQHVGGFWFEAPVTGSAPNKPATDAANQELDDYLGADSAG